MKCSVCNKEMKFVRKFKTSDNRNNRTYERITYWCEKDDVWITVETPVEIAN